MSAEPLYVVSVEDMRSRGELLRMTGSRDVVIETALRVIVDCAPTWNANEFARPTFGITISEVKP